MKSYLEKDILSAAMWSEGKNTSETLETLMGALSELFEQWNVSRWKADVLEERATSSLHPKLSASIFAEGKEIGFIYALNPKIAKDNKVPANLCGFEVDLNKFLKGKIKPDPLIYVVPPKTKVF